MTDRPEPGSLGLAERDRAGALPRWKRLSDPDMPPLAESIGFLVRIVQLQSFQLFYQRFGNADLSVGALTTLGAIHVNPGIRHGVLADTLMIKRPNFTKVINRLEDAGLIVREESRDDKRTTTLHVTKRGVRKLEEARAAILRHHEDMVAVLSGEERQSLIDMLQRVSAHLQTLLGAEPPVQ